MMVCSPRAYLPEVGDVVWIFLHRTNMPALNYVLRLDTELSCCHPTIKYESLLGGWLQQMVGSLARMPLCDQGGTDRLFRGVSAGELEFWSRRVGEPLVVPLCMAVASSGTPTSGAEDCAASFAAGTGHVVEVFVEGSARACCHDLSSFYAGATPTELEAVLLPKDVWVRAFEPASECYPYHRLWLCGGESDLLPDVAGGRIADASPESLSSVAQLVDTFPDVLSFVAKPQRATSAPSGGWAKTRVVDRLAEKLRTFDVLAPPLAVLEDPRTWFAAPPLSFSDAPCSWLQDKKRHGTKLKPQRQVSGVPLGDKKVLKRLSAVAPLPTVEGPANSASAFVTKREEASEIDVEQGLHCSPPRC